MVQEHQAKTYVTEWVMRIMLASKTSLHQSGVGLGAIFKDEHDHVVLATAMKLKHIQDPCIAEMAVIRRALIEAQQRSTKGGDSVRCKNYSNLVDSPSFRGVIYS